MPAFTLSHFFLFLLFHSVLCDSYTSFLLMLMCPPLFPLLYTFLHPCYISMPPYLHFQLQLQLLALAPIALLTMGHITRPCLHYIHYCAQPIALPCSQLHFCTLPIHFSSLPIKFSATITLSCTPVTLCHWLPHYDPMPLLHFWPFQPQGRIQENAMGGANFTN